MQPIVDLIEDIRIDSYLSDDAPRSLADDVLDGLTRPFKELAPKHFYDARGSALFERICDLDEYYPTRTERAILEHHAGAIAATTGARELVELGSGSPAKASLLLAAMDECSRLERYVPMDVSESALRESAATLSKRFPGLRVHGVLGDFERHLDGVPAPLNGGPRLVAFLGGTIGNFPPGTRRRFLRSLADLLGPADHLLLGTDLVKDPRVLEAAYDDSQGITAEFNRNVLHVLNRELNADFEPANFEHVAFFDRRHEWIEIRLRAREACHVRISDLDLDVSFAAGEEMRTEISAKFTRDRVQRDYRAAGLRLSGWYTDPDEQFALSLASRATPAHANGPR
ncbi:MAG TPA: L-histidine N(alpha)-methyltransferase [Solirubrobacteraceae bacterium]|nr:L-histidine N(alpha)-methyltransferase [Solirubrobacteraceae bacterium]